MPNWGKFSSTALVFDTFSAKYCLVLAIFAYLQIYLNFAQIGFPNRYKKKCITTSYFVGISYNKKCVCTLYITN